MLAMFMEVLDTSVANMSLPHIAGSLSASIDESTWVLTLLSGVERDHAAAGRLVLDSFGRKRFYMICVAVFTLSSFYAALPPAWAYWSFSEP